MKHDEEQQFRVSQALKQAKHVNRESRILVQQLARLRDRLGGSGSPEERSAQHHE